MRIGFEVHRNRICILIALGVCACLSLVWAQPQRKRATNRSNASPIVAENMNVLLKKPMNMNMRDAPLSQVLAFLSKYSGMNFVSGQGVHKEKITVLLDNTPVDEAINLVVRAAGLGYEIVGNSVLIAEPGKLKGEVGYSTYVIRLKYANAGEVKKMLGDLTDRIKVDAGGNRLICYTSPRVINEIERIVKSIDHPHLQVMLETRVMEVSMDKLKELGIDWTSLTPIPMTIKHGGIPLQSGYKPEGWTATGLKFGTALNLLSQKGDARVLMNSKLTTTNNRKATLHIGEAVPYIVQSYSPDAAGAQLDVAKEEVGVKLSVLPHVNDDYEITLTVEPEVSSIIGWKGPRADMPHVRLRKTMTSVRVKNGQTVFLAGLLSEEKTVEIRKFPLLGDIPLLGRIFQKSKNLIQKKNLIIEITPTIINSDLTAADVGGAKASLQRSPGRAIEIESPRPPSRRNSR